LVHRINDRKARLAVAEAGENMRLAIRTLQRIAIFGLGAVSVWLIVDVFELVDRRLPWILAVSATYIIGAYVILPRAVRMGLKILQRQHVPSFTITGDGLPGDPVNLALAGTAAQLRSAFATAGWVEADRLDIASSCRMVRAFVLNKSYPTAPFSTLYLFGRGQDIGFQKAIGNSPRKRHHVRFWAQNLTDAETDWNSAAFWLNDERPANDEHVLWVGAGTKDTGFSLTRMTFQMTHATDADTNVERNYIVDELSKCGAIGKVTIYKTGDELITKHVNHYVTDGDIAVGEIERPRI
jgi:hypothetical protein